MLSANVPIQFSGSLVGTGFLRGGKRHVVTEVSFSISCVAEAADPLSDRPFLTEINWTEGDADMRVISIFGVDPLQSFELAVSFVASQITLQPPKHSKNIP